MRKKFRLIALICYSLFFSISLKAQDEVKIGTQIWSTKNLNVSRFRNGDIIVEAKTKEEWGKANNSITPAWCYYENDSTKGKIYGKLYNFYAIIDARGLAPNGWRIPNDKEWDILVNFLGGAWTLTGNKLKTITNWKVNNGNNSSGFSALPGGKRGLDGNCIYMGIFAFFWSTSLNNNGYASYRNIVDFSDRINTEYAGKGNGFSVRCVKN